MSDTECMEADMSRLAWSTYEDAARAVIEPSLEPDYSRRLRAAAELLRDKHSQNPNLETPIIVCAGPSPEPYHRDRLRGLLAVFG